VPHLLISEAASQLVQLATIITMAVSSYVVVYNYPTPLAAKLITSFQMDASTIIVRPSQEGSNTAPTCSPIGNDTLLVDDTLDIAFDVADAETAADQLQVTYVNHGNGVGNPLGTLRATLSGTGTRRTLRLIPKVAGRLGGFVQVSDGSLSVNEYIHLWARHPTNTAAPAFDVRESFGAYCKEEHGVGNWTRRISLHIDDNDTPAESLTVTAHSEQQGIIRDDDIFVGGHGNHRWIRYRYRNILRPSALMHVYVTDGEYTDTLSPTLQTFGGPSRVPPVIAALPDTIHGVLNRTSGPRAFIAADLKALLSEMELSGSSGDSMLVPDSGIVFDSCGRMASIALTPGADVYGQADVYVSLRNRSAAYCHDTLRFHVTNSDASATQFIDFAFDSAVAVRRPPRWHVRRERLGMCGYDSHARGGHVRSALSRPACMPRRRVCSPGADSCVSAEAVSYAVEGADSPKISGGGLTEGADISGRRLAFAGGYNDQDGDSERAHQLR